MGFSVKKIMIIINYKPRQMPFSFAFIGMILWNSFTSHFPQKEGDGKKNNKLWNTLGLKEI